MTEAQTQSQSMDVPRVTVEEVKARLQRGEPIAFVDSRSEHSWQESEVTIPGSIRVPPDNVRSQMSKVPKDRSVVTFCT